MLGESTGDARVECGGQLRAYVYTRWRTRCSIGRDVKGKPGCTTDDVELGKTVELTYFDVRTRRAFDS